MKLPLPKRYHLSKLERMMMHAIQRLEAENDKLMKIISDHPRALTAFLKGN